MDMRIVTRPDFDGVVCAALLKEALNTAATIQWVQPNDIQDGRYTVQSIDILANLPYDPHCALWFDHHISNAVTVEFQGLFRVAPSAAGLVYEYYQDRLAGRFDELVRQTDRIDSAQLSLDQILYPERYPYIILSMATSYDPVSQISFCTRLVELLRNWTIEQIIADDQVAHRCRQVTEANSAYQVHLQTYTIVRGGVSITDFRSLQKAPEGNRFLVYSLFPQSFVNLKLVREGPKIGVKLGHSIVNQRCRVNVGKLMSAYGGGGHYGAGACRLDPDRAPVQVEEIILILMKNQPDG